MKKIKKHSFLTTLGIQSTIVLALILIGIIPLLWQISNDSKNLSRVKNDALLLEDQYKEIQQFKKLYPSYKDNLEKINQAFVDNQNPVDFIKFLEKTANQSGVQSKISLIPGQKNILAFQIGCSGNFEQILAFTDSLEHGPYLVNIKNMTIDQAGNEQESAPSGKVEASITLSVFTKP